MTTSADVASQQPQLLTNIEYFAVNFRLPQDADMETIMTAVWIKALQYAKSLVASHGLPEVEDEEIAQMTCIKIWRSLVKNGTFIEYPRTYIGVTVCRCCVDMKRKKHSDKTYYPEQAGNSPGSSFFKKILDPAPTTEDEVLSLLGREEIRGLINEILLERGDTCQRIFEDRYFNNIPILQVAEKFGLPKGTIRSRMGRTWRKLRMQRERFRDYL